MSLGSACGPVFDGRCWTTFAETDSIVHEAAQKGDLHDLANGLKAAAEAGDTKIISSINERNSLGCTPLRLAAAGQLLFDECVDVRCKLYYLTTGSPSCA